MFSSSSVRPKEIPSMQHPMRATIAVSLQNIRYYTTDYTHRRTCVRAHTINAHKHAQTRANGEPERTRKTKAWIHRSIRKRVCILRRTIYQEKASIQPTALPDPGTPKPLQVCYRLLP